MHGSPPTPPPPLSALFPPSILILWRRPSAFPPRDGNSCVHIFTLCSVRFNVAVKIFSKKIKTEVCDTCHDNAVLITQVTCFLVCILSIFASEFLSLKEFWWSQIWRNWASAQVRMVVVVGGKEWGLTWVNPAKFTSDIVCVKVKIFPTNRFSVAVAVWNVCIAAADVDRLWDVNSFWCQNLSSKTTYVTHVCQAFSSTNMSL